MKTNTLLKLAFGVGLVYLLTKKRSDKTELIAGGSPVSSLLENNGFSATANKDYFSKMIGRKPDFKVTWKDSEAKKKKVEKIYAAWATNDMSGSKNVWAWKVKGYLVLITDWWKFPSVLTSQKKELYIDAALIVQTDYSSLYADDFDSEKIEYCFNRLFYNIGKKTGDERYFQLAGLSNAGDYELAFELAKGQGLI